jgi:hypothetical protein
VHPQWAQAQGRPHEGDAPPLDLAPPSLE